MRGIILGALLIIWWSAVFSQKTENWRAFIDNKNQAREVIGDGVFMVESTKSELIEKGSLVILRTIDRLHHIVKGSVSADDKSWLVNDDWKLNVSGSDAISHYYVVTSSTFSLDQLDAFDIVRYYESNNTYLIEGELETIKRLLLSNPDVIHITDKVARPTVENRVIDLNLNPNRVNKIHHHYPLLDGSSEIISIQENRFDEEDIDLLNRSIVTGLESETSDNHATEMATIIAGKGNSFITGKGVAQDVTITSSDFFDAMPDPDGSYIELGVSTQNHSYGIPRENEYGVEARAFDISAYNNRNLLHVFSSGNEGLEVSADGVYQGIEGFANLTGNIKMTKNSLIVGSTDTVGNVPSFVSRGPTYDGRVKPEVVAYSVVGSSNSAALVSGVAVLLQQQYREDNGTDMPSSLVKAILINSADDVGPDGLDFLTGYGSVNAWRSLESLRNDQYFEGSVTNGNTESFNLNLPADAVNLKATLVWTDPAANVKDFPALVNDLDLRLIASDLSTILPWVLDPSPNVSDLSKPAIRGIDDLNNVEQVTISSPTTNYTLEVEGSAVAGSQDFYIAWQYDVADTFEWDYPTGSDNMPYNGETGSYFRWSTTKTGTGELAYSEDEANWIVLDSNVDLTKGLWRWNNPPQISNAVKARMTIGVKIFETDFFTVSEPLSASVGFNCADSLMLRWNPSPNAIDYTVFSLGVEELEMVTTVSDTFLVIPDTSVFSTRKFSIQPNLPDGKGLLPAPTFDYTLQGVDCYVFSFFQTVALDTGIYLNLRLGTTYGMEEVIFERNEFDSFTTIETISSPDYEEITFLDTDPNQGYNEHRAIIRFENGQELILSAGSSYYMTEIPLRIFPNPAIVGESLGIITRSFEDRTPILELIDDRGALVHKQEIQGTQDDIPTVRLKPGVYFYRLYADGEVFTGRLLIR
ncbi:S8 family peptidase [Ekhidna sp.]|uniref:S8 family peptidase n=1 Tax=Ekhidna sp. TaxID=2608089 RepID=UPI003C7AFB05